MPIARGYSDESTRCPNCKELLLKCICDIISVLMLKETVFEFCYTDCIHESSYMTVSIHRTKKGAEIAQEFHKQEEKKKYLKWCATKERQKQFPWPGSRSWNIIESELKN